MSRGKEGRRHLDILEPSAKASNLPPLVDLSYRYVKERPLTFRCTRIIHVAFSLLGTTDRPGSTLTTDVLWIRLAESPTWAKLHSATSQIVRPNHPTRVINSRT